MEYELHMILYALECRVMQCEENAQVAADIDPCAYDHWRAQGIIAREIADDLYKGRIKMSKGA